MFNFNLFSGLRRLAARRLVRKVLPQHRVFTLHELDDLLANQVAWADLYFVISDMIFRSCEVRPACNTDEPFHLTSSRGGPGYDAGLFVQHRPVQ